MDAGSKADMGEVPALTPLSRYRRALVRHAKAEKALQTYKEMVSEHTGHLTLARKELHAAQEALDAEIRREADVE
jgi:hypothetical protein